MNKEKRSMETGAVIKYLIREQHYLYGEFIPFHGVCMIMRQIYNVGLFVHCTADERGGCYYFNTIVGAMNALAAWKNNEGKSAHPPGNWMKYKSSTGDIVNPNYKKDSI